MTGDRPVIDALRAGLSRCNGIISAYLFGSQALDRGHRDSDVDVGVFFDRQVYPLAADRFEARLRLIGQLQTTVRQADLVILNDTPPHLVRRIMTDGRRLVVTDSASTTRISARPSPVPPISNRS